MKKIGVKISRTIPQKPDLKLEEVTAANYVNMDINQIEDNISVLESKIQSDMSIVVINALTTLYQKVCLHGVQHVISIGNWVLLSIQ